MCVSSWDWLPVKDDHLSNDWSDAICPDLLISVPSSLTFFQLSWCLLGVSGRQRIGDVDLFSSWWVWQRRDLCRAVGSLCHGIGWIKWKQCRAHLALKTSYIRLNNSCDYSGTPNTTWSDQWLCLQLMNPKSCSQPVARRWLNQSVILCSKLHYSEGHSLWLSLQSEGLNPIHLPPYCCFAALSFMRTWGNGTKDIKILQRRRKQ